METGYLISGFVNGRIKPGFKNTKSDNKQQLFLLNVRADNENYRRQVLSVIDSYNTANIQYRHDQMTPRIKILITHSIFESKIQMTEIEYYPILYIKELLIETMYMRNIDIGILRNTLDTNSIVLLYKYR